jgi:nucleotide-binding universal stress UspA family protein
MRPRDARVRLQGVFKRRCAMYLTPSRIVVGVDGSAQSRDAVRWAYDQVRGTDAIVDLVHVWHVPVEEAAATREKLPAAAAADATPVATSALKHAYDEELEAAALREEALKATRERRSMRLLERVSEAALGVDGDPERVRLVPLEGEAGPTLVNEAAAADLLVVSSHRTSRMAATMLGSVSLYCTLHALCPVVVLPAFSRQRRAAIERELSAR